jgi:hypothetical protein
VLAVCGDGGFMMNSQEMETAVRLSLNLVVLIVQDNAYGMIHWKQAVDSCTGGLLRKQASLGRRATRACASSRDCLGSKRAYAVLHLRADDDGFY